MIISIDYLNQWWVGITRTEVPVQASVGSGWSSSVGSIGGIGIVSVWLCIGKLALVLILHVHMHAYLVYNCYFSAHVCLLMIVLNLDNFSTFS